MESRLISNRNIIAIGCFIVMFIHLGTIGTAGIFIPQFINTFEVPVSKISLNVTFSSLTGFISSLIVGRIQHRLSVKKMLLIGSVAGFLHYLVGGMANGVGLLYLGSVFGGITFGFGTQTCNAAIITRWFEEKSASVMGFVFGGAAFGSAVLLFISGILIESIGWRSTYIIFALMHLFIAIPVILFIIKEKENHLQSSERDIKGTRMDKVDNEKQTIVGEIEGVKLTEIHKSVSFWLLMISMVLCGTLITGFKTFIPSYWQSTGISSLKSSEYISIFMILATVATMVSGTIADKFGRKAFITYLYLTYIIGMIFVLIYSPSGGISNNTIIIVMMAVSYPLYGSIPATVVLEVFGYQHYKELSAELMGAFYIGLSIVSPIIGGLRDITGTYKSGFMTITIFSVISYSLILAAIKTSKLNKNYIGKKTEVSNKTSQEITQFTISEKSGPACIGMEIIK